MSWWTSLCGEKAGNWYIAEGAGKMYNLGVVKSEIEDKVEAVR